NTGAPNPSSLGGGETDKHVIYEGLSRVAADAVMAGAETIRGGRAFFSVWHPELVAPRQSLTLLRHPIPIVATPGGIPIDEAPLYNDPDLQVVIVTVQAVSDAMRRALSRRPWITPIVMHDATDLPSAFRQMRSLGIRTISCVGGRTLARQLIDAGVIQDIYLTRSPKSGGEPHTPLYPRPLARDLVVGKRGTGADTGVVFEHTRLISSRA